MPKFDGIKDVFVLTCFTAAAVAFLLAFDLQFVQSSESLAGVYRTSASRLD